MIRLLSRLLRTGIPAALSLSTIVGQAQQRKAYHLGTDFGLNPSQTYALAADLGTLDANKAKYPDAYKRVQAIKPGAEGDKYFQALSAFDIAWLQATWSGLGGGQVITSATAYLVSYNPVTVPEGYYMATIIPEVSMGDYAGAGCGWNQPLGTAHNTIIGIYHEKWQGDPLERHGFSSSTWGKLGGSFYAEGYTLRDLRVDGRHLTDGSTTFNSTGFRLWQMGTGSTVERLRADECRTAGFDFFNPTPALVGGLTAMHNVQAGVLHTGGWGSTLNLLCLEADDNDVVYEQREAFGYAPGGTVRAFIKGETGLKQESVTPKRGQMAAILRGQFAADLIVQMTAKDIVVDALVLVDPIVGTTQPQQSTLRLQGKGNVESGQGYRTLIQQAQNPLAAGARWTVPDFRSFVADYTSEGGGKVVSFGSTLTKQASTCTGRRGFLPKGGTFDYNTCLPAHAYVIGTTAVTPPPACTATWVAGTRTCTACTNGTQVCTTPYVSTGTCTPVATKPADIVETVVCNTPPPTPTGSTIDPADVLVVVNSMDPTSAAMGAAYAAAWGIPVGNITTVNLGTTDQLSNAQLLTTARAAIEAKGEQYTVLAFSKPSRYVSQSITSAITYGARTVSNLTTSELYQYTGTKPRTDKGVAPAFLLVSDKYIRRDAHGTRPQGQSILLLAKDMSSQSNPRGSARAAQTATGVTVWDNRSLSNVGSGNNACNYISSLCWRTDRKPTTTVVAAYQSMFMLGDAGTVAWAKGFYGDHVTSFGGFLPAVNADGTNSNGQTPLTYHLDKGASMSVGSVSEPWQGSNGSLAQQFVNVSVFHPLFVGGKPVGVATYAAVQCPDRMLFAGDPLCAPFAK